MSSPFRKNILLSPSGKSNLRLALSRLDKRGVRVVTNVGAGCDGRGWCRKTSGAGADGEVVWSWRPDAGVKLAEFSAGDGGKKARSPGRARSKPLKPSRRECWVKPVDLW